MKCIRSMSLMNRLCNPDKLDYKMPFGCEVFQRRIWRVVWFFNKRSELHWIGCTSTCSHCYSQQHIYPRYLSTGSRFHQSTTRILIECRWCISNPLKFLKIAFSSNDEKGDSDEKIEVQQRTEHGDREAGGVPVVGFCCEHGMSCASFYKWWTKFGGMDASLMARMKELDEEKWRELWCGRTEKNSHSRGP